MYVNHLILHLCFKFHGNIPNDCQDITDLLLGYFNLGHPVCMYIFIYYKTHIQGTKKEKNKTKHQRRQTYKEQAAVTVMRMYGI